jgi:hypothetical protein
VSDRIDPEAIADEVLPLDSTDPQQVLAAANLLVDLVRRLCRATRHAEAVPTPQAADAIVSALAIAVGRLPQLCQQLADRVHDLGDLAGLTADQPGPIPTGGAVAIACRAYGRLTWAAEQLAAVSASIDDAQRDTSRLYLDDTASPAEEPPLPPQPKLQGP